MKPCLRYSEGNGYSETILLFELKSCDIFCNMLAHREYPHTHCHLHGRSEVV